MNGTENSQQNDELSHAIIGDRGLAAWEIASVVSSILIADRPILGQLFLSFGWGLVQQYVLHSFINRRAQIIRGPGRFSILLVAIIFAGLHLPNPWLTVITFAGGVIWA